MQCYGAEVHMIKIYYCLFIDLLMHTFVTGVAAAKGSSYLAAINTVSGKNKPYSSNKSASVLSLHLY